ncbi:MAG: 50S ribosomal protein L30 [Desulfobacterota bacterium]|nr:50S ribosomal protein L30 [Thermodesulfobacteriota bacterium]
MTAQTEGERRIRVRWKRSVIGRPEPQKRIIKALGFKRLNQVRLLPDHPTIRGMIQQVPHLVELIDQGEEA